MPVYDNMKRTGQQVPKWADFGRTAFCRYRCKPSIHKGPPIVHFTPGTLFCHEISAKKQERCHSWVVSWHPDEQQLMSGSWLWWCEKKRTWVLEWPLFQTSESRWMSVFKIGRLKEWTQNRTSESVDRTSNSLSDPKVTMTTQMISSEWYIDSRSRLDI